MPRATSTTRRNKTKPRKPQVPAGAWQAPFLEELAKCGNVGDACKRARIERSTAYKHRKESKEFADAWRDALDTALDKLEKEAFRRAHDGVKRLVLYKGKPVVVGKKNLIEIDYSDALLQFLLKAHRPDVYRERAEQWVLNFDVAQLSDEQLERLAAGEDPRIVLATASEGGTGTPSSQRQSEP